MKKTIKLTESDLESLVNKVIKEEYIGKKGKEKVSKFLHKMVDKYVSEIDEMSEDADRDFFVKDFVSWYRDR